ncbi:MAG: hypothetical protein CL398_04995 [Acidiferrobacteraceae bacterium]|nr:hypothetical protein [Acidiferrobacteraceae bacterium]
MKNYITDEQLREWEKLSKTPTKKVDGKRAEQTLARVAVPELCKEVKRLRENETHNVDTTTEVKDAARRRGQALGRIRARLIDDEWLWDLEKYTAQPTTQGKVLAIKQKVISLLDKTFDIV